MAQKKSRQTFEKRKREQAVKERRLRKQERRAAARLAKLEDSGESVDSRIASGRATAAEGDQPTVVSEGSGHPNEVPEMSRRV